MKRLWCADPGASWRRFPTFASTAGRPSPWERLKAIKWCAVTTAGSTTPRGSAPAFLPFRASIPSPKRPASRRIRPGIGTAWCGCACPTRPGRRFRNARCFEDPDYREVFRNRWIWKASAARSAENFFDQAHFAFVHEGVPGQPRQAGGCRTRPLKGTGEALNFWVDVPADKTHAVPYVRNYRVFRPPSPPIRKKKCPMAESRVT